MTSENDIQDNEISADVLAENLPEPARLTPGGLLQAQRETLELTLKQVADKLNLTMHYVSALESDSYDKLPGDVFVRGYIRSYSNLLQLDPQQVLDVYIDFTTHKLARKEEAIKRHARRRKDKNRPWIVVSGIAFVGMALALWYFNTAGSADDVVPAALNTTGGSIPVFEGNTGIDPVAPQSLAQNSPALAPPAFSEPSGSSEIMTTSGEGMLASADSVVAEGEVASESSAAALSLNPASESAAIISLNWNGSDTLQLVFSEDSWVEIEDRGGSDVHRELRQRGETLRIRGTAPFAILLGNARAVSLEFNGRPMDFSSNIRADDTVRLSIGM
jgi:cytoskeleton protein RodZ